jgi:hypothetical protein
LVFPLCFGTFHQENLATQRRFPLSHSDTKNLATQTEKKVFFAFFSFPAQGG